MSETQRPAVRILQIVLNDFQQTSRIRIQLKFIQSAKSSPATDGQNQRVYLSRLTTRITQKL
jgi:hypothetical protein